MGHLTAAIKTKQAELQTRKKEKLDFHDGVSKACAKLATAIRGTVGRVRTEIAAAKAQLSIHEKAMAQIQKDIADLRHQISCAKKAMKAIKGPISEAFSAALAVLGIKLTTYFSGEFVGPQISKLAADDCYKTILTHLFTHAATVGASSG